MGGGVRAGAADPSPHHPPARGRGAKLTPMDVPPDQDAPQRIPGGTVLTRTVTITNKRGLHARAAAKFVTTAERFGASIDVLRDEQSVSARSIMGLMMLGAGPGATLELRAEGWDAKEALDALAALVEAGFDEQA
jgi:phosphocarrier protein HPr